MANYIISKAASMVTVHHCSQCGKLNVLSQTLNSQLKYSDDFSITRDAKLAKERHARDELKVVQNSMIDRIERQASKRRYGSARLVGSCKYCQNTEPWARLECKWTSAAGYLILLLCLPVALYQHYIVEADAAEFFLSLLPLLLAEGAVLLLDILRRTMLNRKIDQLDEAALPTFCWNKEQLTEVLQKNMQE